jgi:integrase
MSGRRNRRGFGYIRKLPSRRYQASYTGPDLARHTAPATFTAKQDAEGWLSGEHKLIAAGAWLPPAERTNAARRRLTFGTYSATWLADRDLKPRTRAHYRSLLDRLILPTFSHVALTSITPEKVRGWHALLGAGTPTLRAHAYGLLRTICGTAEGDRLIDSNPCRIRGAGNTKRVRKIRPATLAELETLTAAMPSKYRLMVLLASWCGLRFGELGELRRSDIDLRAELIRVRRAVVRVDGQTIIGTPKSDAGTRDVHLPPHLLPMVKQHLRDNISGGRQGLLFPAPDGVSHLTPTTLYRSFYPAREAADRPDLRFHDLRHTGAVLAASTGATLAELMERLGHSTPRAALRYQHAAADADLRIAKALSALAAEGDSQA